MVTIPVLLIWQISEETNRKNVIKFIDKLLANSATRYTLAGNDSAQSAGTFRTDLWDLYLGRTPVTTAIYVCWDYANGIPSRLLDLFYRKNKTTSKTSDSISKGLGTQSQNEPQDGRSGMPEANGDNRRKTLTIGLEENRP